MPHSQRLMPGRYLSEQWLDWPRGLLVPRPSWPGACDQQGRTAWRSWWSPPCDPCGCAESSSSWPFPWSCFLLLLSAGFIHHVYFDRSGLPDIERFIRFELPTTGKVYDTQGKVLIEVAREYRRVVSYDEVPVIVRQADPGG